MNREAEEMAGTARRGLSIFVRLLTAFLGVVILTGIIFLGTSYVFSRNAMEKFIGDGFRRDVAAINNSFDNHFIRALARDLRLIASSPRMDEYIIASGREKEAMRPTVETLFLQFVTYNKNYETIYFVDASGREKVTAGREGRVSKYRDLRENRLFARVADGMPDNIYFDGPFVGENGKARFTLGLYKTNDETGTFGGAVMIDCDLEEFVEELHRVDFYGANPVWLFTFDGHLLMKPDERTSFDPTRHFSAKNQDIPLVLAVDEGVLAFQDFSILPGQPLVRLAITIPSSLLLKDVKASLRYLVLIFFISIVVAFIIALYISRYLSRPIVRLADASGRLARGELSTRADIRAFGEVQMLVDSFNSMAENMERTTVSKDYVDDIIRSMTETLIVLQPDGTIARANAAACALLDYREEELVGRPIGMVCNDGFPGGTDWLHNSHAGWSATRVETEYLARDGRQIPVLFSASAMLDEKGALHGIVCVARDITARKRNEEALKRQNDVLSKITAVISDLIVCVAEMQSFDIRYPNLNPVRCWEIMEGCDPACHAYGSEVFACQSRGGGPCCRVRETDASPSIKQCRECPTFRQAHPDELSLVGEDFNIMMKILQAKSEELDETRRQLIQSEKMSSIGQLAAGVAHEINNPIGFISSNMTTLSEYARDIQELISRYKDFKEKAIVCGCTSIEGELTKIDELWKSKDIDFVLEDLDKVVKESLDGAKRVAHIVKNLKEFSHVDESEWKPADLNEGIESTLAIIWNELKYKATVVKEYGDIPRIECYPMQLNQVFMNLLVNAAHAIPEKGEIRIRTWQEDGFVCVAISDTGTGIPDDIKNKIFNPFFTTKGVGKGTGLGLSIAYGIIEKHKGSIKVDSKMGVGTTFTIRLPFTAR